ncbi:hypothetical protein SBRCBS47491_006441 [Sporothrix bragantina]|uniref:Uncharacterized protein n=1 Tax=Sporothrix bragantina TaxID=671064 RepID=A0ABP0C769_9PEZI
MAAVAHRNHYVTPPSGQSGDDSSAPRTATPPMGVSATAAYVVPRRERSNAVVDRGSAVVERDIQVQRDANVDNDSPTSSGQTGSNEVRIVIQPTRSSRRGGTDSTSPYMGGSSTGRLQRQWPMPPGHLGPAVSMFMDESYTATATGTAAGTRAGTDVEGEGATDGAETSPQPYDPTAWSTTSDFGGSVTPETQQQYLQYQRYVRDEEEREQRQKMLHQMPTRLPVPTQQQPSGLSTRRASGVPSSAVLGSGQQWQQWTGYGYDDAGEGASNLRFSSRNDSSRSRSAVSNRSTEILPSRPAAPAADEGSPQGSTASNQTETGNGNGRRGRFNFGSIGYGRAL